MESILCWPTTAFSGACSGMCLIHPMTLLRGKRTFPFSAGIYCRSSLVRGGALCLLSPPPIQPLNLSGRNLFRPCACCHSLYKFRCQSVLLFLEDTASLDSSITSGSYTLSVSSSAEIPESRRGAV